MDGLVSVLAVDQKITVSGEDNAVGLQFTHTQQTSIRKRHRHVGVFPKQLDKLVGFTCGIEIGTDQALLPKRQQFVLRFRKVAEQKPSLGQDGIASQEWRFQLRRLLSHPSVILVAIMNQRRQWPGVNNDCGIQHSP